MDLDDLKSTWATHGAALERSLAITEQLLRETMTTKAHAAMIPYVRWRVVELVVGALASVIVGSILASHLGESRYLLAGGAVLAYAIGMTVASAVIVVRGSRFDYRGPVTVIQRQLEELRSSTIERELGVLGGVVVWLQLPLYVRGCDRCTLTAKWTLACLVANLASDRCSRGILLAQRSGTDESRIVNSLSGLSLAMRIPLSSHTVRA